MLQQILVLANNILRKDANQGEILNVATNIGFGELYFAQKCGSERIINSETNTRM